MFSKEYLKILVLIPSLLLKFDKDAITPRLFGRLFRCPLCDNQIERSTGGSGPKAEVRNEPRQNNL